MTASLPTGRPGVPLGLGFLPRTVLVVGLALGSLPDGSQLFCSLGRLLLDAAEYIVQPLEAERYGLVRPVAREARVVSEWRKVRKRKPDFTWEARAVLVAEDLKRG